MRAARKIRIHCPISLDTFKALLTGNLAAIESDPTAAKMLAIIRAANPLGDFDLYRGVFELSLGMEGFTPTARAQPTEGKAGIPALSPTAVITTYVDAGADRGEVLAALDELMRAHPWEVPVIELSDETIRLVQRCE